MKVARDRHDSGISLESLKFAKSSMTQFIRKETVDAKDEYEHGKDDAGRPIMERPIEVHTQINPVRDKVGVDYHFDKFHITYVWPDKSKSQYWWKESGKNWSAESSAHDAPDGALERAATLIREIKKHY
jgi:hypothetical protein